MLAGSEYEVITQQSLGITDAPETGLTFVENAILKARHASQAAGVPALADDSGIVVNALQGQPGIYSARYAGDNATAADNMTKLVAAMKNIPAGQRQCAYHCVLVFLKTPIDPTPIICHGVWEGSLLEAPRGEKGFGYDPLFFIDSHNCSAAELPLHIKNHISHRGKALRQLLKTLN